MPLPPLRIAVAGPIASADIAPLLDADARTLPRGYAGAPFLVTLIGSLIERGHRISAITLSSDLPLDGGPVVVHGERLSLHVVPMRPRAWPWNGRRPGRIVDLYRSERRGLARAIVDARPDLVHAHWAYEFAWAALATGLPHVVTCHDAPLRIPRYYRRLRHVAYRWLRAAMAWHVLGHARSVTAVSPYMASEVRRLCRAPVGVVPNPIDPAAFARRRRRAPGRRIVMASNGWSAFKNQAAALRALAILAETVADVELVALGIDFGPDEVAERWWRAAGLRGRVVFAGARRHDEMLDAIAEADVFLHPSLEESFGVVLAEAMALAVPIVAGRASGAVPWVVGAGGVLVDVTDPRAIADALRALLLDPERASELGRAGRERCIEAFAAPRVAAAYEEHYRRALDAHARPAGAAERVVVQ